MSNHQQITIDELETIARLNLAGPQWQPMILLGSPGTAKTQWLTERLPELYAEALGVTVDDIGLVVEKPARRDSAELAGVALPIKEADGAVATQFTRSPVLKKIQDKGLTYGILLWDEIAAAGAPEQKVAADSFDPDEHSIGGERLPAGWIVVGTGNRAKDKAGAVRLLSHLTNRAMVYEMRFCIHAWIKWAVENNINPVVQECAEAYHDQGFFADAVPAEDIAYCTPRSLVRVAGHLDTLMSSIEFDGTIPPVIERMFASNVGPNAANVLCQWIAQRDHVPTAAEILSNPEGAKVPDQTGFQMVAANIAMAEVTDAQSATAVLHYVCRLRTDLQVSLGTKLMAISTRAGWTVTDPLAAAFISKFHQLLPLAISDQ
jgi:hypothetical protein